MNDGQTNQTWQGETEKNENVEGVSKFSRSAPQGSQME